MATIPCHLGPSLGNTESTTSIQFNTNSNEVKGQFSFYAGAETNVETYDFTGIQLEEGIVGTSYTPYLNLEELQEKSNDTGWLEAPLETDASTFDWNKLSYRKINGIVYVSGTFKLLNPSWAKVFATLPQGFRPKVEADFVCRGVDNATVVVTITNNGKMAVLQLVPGDFSSEVSGLVSCSFIADN